MKLLIIGAGYTGIRLAARGMAEGHEVVGTTRSSETLIELDEMGGTGVRFDVLADDPSDVLAEHLGPDTSIVYSVPTLFDDPQEGRHTEPVEAVLQAAREAGCRRFVYLSSTSVYGDHDGEPVTEDSARRPSSPVGKMRRDIEDVVLGFGDIDTKVIRIVGIYGPGRTLDRYVSRGRYKLVDGGQKLTNRIHVDDLGRLILAVVTRAPGGARAYVATDGNPVRVVDLVDWMVEHLGIERPEEVSLEAYRRERGENAAARWRNTYLARNDRVVEELGFEFEFPTVIDGYRDIFAEQLA